jgi:hypothetical protein
MNIYMKNFVVSIFCAIILYYGGCSGKVSSQGTVKFPDGTPLRIGTVYLSNGLVMYQGTIQKDGTFSIGELKDGDGIPPGTYKVWIADANTIENVYDAKKENIVNRIDHIIIDPKFADKNMSDLQFKIEKGQKNQIEIVVEKPQPKFRRLE